MKNVYTIEARLGLESSFLHFIVSGPLLWRSLEKKVISGTNVGLNYFASVLPHFCFTFQRSNFPDS